MAGPLRLRFRRVASLMRPVLRSTPQLAHSVSSSPTSYPQRGQILAALSSILSISRVARKSSVSAGLLELLRVFFAAVTLTAAPHSLQRTRLPSASSLTEKVVLHSLQRTLIGM